MPSFSFFFASYEEIRNSDLPVRAAGSFSIQITSCLFPILSIDI